MTCSNSSVVEYLAIMCKTLGSIPNTPEKISSPLSFQQVTTSKDHHPQTASKRRPLIPDLGLLFLAMLQPRTLRNLV